MKPLEIDRSVLEQLKSSLQRELADLQERARIKALEVEELKTSLQDLKDGNIYLWQILQSLKGPLEGKDVLSLKKTNESLQRSCNNLPENGCKSSHSANLKYYANDELGQNGYLNHIQDTPYVQQKFCMGKKSKNVMNDDLKRCRSKASEYIHEAITDTGTKICYPNKSLPPSPYEFQVLRQIDSTSLLVWWNPPNGPGTSGYEIYVDGNLHYQVRSGSRTKALLQNLNLDGQVNLSLYAISAIGRSAEPAKLVYFGGSKSVGGMPNPSIYHTDIGNKQQEFCTLFDGRHSQKSFATSCFTLPYVNSYNFYAPPCYPELAKYIAENPLLSENVPSENFPEKSNILPVTEVSKLSGQVLSNDSILSTETVAVSSLYTQKISDTNDNAANELESNQEDLLLTEISGVNRDEEYEKNKNKYNDGIQNTESSEMKKSTKNLNELTENVQLRANICRTVENEKSKIKLNTDASQYCKNVNVDNPSNDTNFKNFVDEQLKSMISAAEQNLKESKCENTEELNTLTNILDLEERKLDALTNIDGTRSISSNYTHSNCGNDINIPISESFHCLDNLTTSFSSEQIQIMISALQRVEELTRIPLTDSLLSSEEHDIIDSSSMENVRNGSLLNFLRNTGQYINYNGCPENPEYKILLESLSEKDLSDISIVDISVVERNVSKEQFLNAINNEMTNTYISKHENQQTDQSFENTTESVTSDTDKKKNEGNFQSNGKKNDSISLLYLKENISFSALSITENEHDLFLDRNIADHFLKMQENSIRKERISPLIDNLLLESNMKTEISVQNCSQTDNDQHLRESLLQKYNKKAEYISDFSSTTDVMASKKCESTEENLLHNLLNVLQEETIISVYSDEVKNNRPISLEKLNIDTKLNDYAFECSKLENNRSISMKEFNIDTESSEDYLTTCEDESEQSLNCVFLGLTRKKINTELSQLESQLSLHDCQLKKYSLQNISVPVSNHLMTPNYSIYDLKERKEIANELEKRLILEEQKLSENSINEFDVRMDDVQISRKDRMLCSSPSRTFLVLSDSDSDHCEPTCDDIMLLENDILLHTTINKSSSLLQVISIDSDTEQCTYINSKTRAQNTEIVLKLPFSEEAIKREENLQSSIGPEIDNDLFSANTKVLKSHEIIQIYSSKPKKL